MILERLAEPETAFGHQLELEVDTVVGITYMHPQNFITIPPDSYTFYDAYIAQIEVIVPSDGSSYYCMALPDLQLLQRFLTICPWRDIIREIPTKYVALIGWFYARNHPCHASRHKVSQTTSHFNHGFA